MSEQIDDLLKTAKQAAGLKRRYTKPDTLSREWGYYINMDSAENGDIEFKYYKGRVHSDVIEKLGLIEDILEVISVDQLLSFIKMKKGR